jgi:Fe2+ or Zn2+ uptake regulation protein
MNSLEIFEKTLREARLSLTKPRRAVFEALQHHKSLTMSELVAACPDIDRASVYRTAEVFERLGVVARIPTGWKYRLELGEAFHEHHHHANQLFTARSNLKTH